MLGCVNRATKPILVDFIYTYAVFFSKIFPEAPSLTNESALDLDAPDGDRGPQGGQRQALREDPFPAGIRRRILAAKPVLYRRRGGIALQEYVRTKAGPLLHILQPGMKTEHD